MTTSVRNIIVRGDDASNDEVFLRINTGNYEIGSHDSGGDHKATYTVGSDAGTWVHIAGVYDGTTWRLYRNGVQVATSTDATGAVAIDAGWSIGANADGDGDFFDGMIDDVHASARAYTTPQIKALMGTESDVMTHRWTFDEAVWDDGDTVADSVGTSDGTVKNISSKETKVTASDGAAGDEFGYWVAISGSTAVSGAPLDDYDSKSNAGSAYIFSDSGSGWSQVAQLKAEDGAAGDNFGHGVAISGDIAVIGAHLDDYDSKTDAGSAYVFSDTGSGWTQVAKLTPSDAATGDYFGACVAISGDTAIVGADMDDYDSKTDVGSAYIFKKTGAGWSQVAKLTPSDGATEDYFGVFVAVSGNTAIVGADADDDNGSASGSAYIFSDNGSGWSQIAKLTANDGAAGDNFGICVAISGDTAIIGAHQDDYDGKSDAGSAYIFKSTGAGWTQVAKLTPDDSAAGDKFGWNVAIDGNTAVVTSWCDDDNGDASGSVYVFKDTGSGWTQVAKVTPSDGAAQDYFGWSVAVSGSIAVIGATGNDDDGTDSGSAYFYDSAPDGAVDGAIELDGTDDYVSVPNVLSGFSDFSLSVNVYLDDYSTSDRAVLGLWKTSDEQIKLWHDTTDGWTVVVKNSGGTDYEVKAGSPETSSRWVHLVVTYEKNGSLKLYVNGTSVGTPASPTTDVPTTSTAMYVGAINDAGTYFDGKIDDLCIYTNVFTATEVDDLYDSVTLTGSVECTTNASYASAVGRLKYVLGPGAYQLYKNDSAAETEEKLAKYADVFYAYNLDGEVARKVSRNSCGTCSPSSSAGTTYTRSDNPNYPGSPTDPNNTWARKTVAETRDSQGRLRSRETTYSNHLLQTMLSVAETFDPDDRSDVTRSASFTRYNSDGQVDMTADNAAIDLPADLTDLEEHSGVSNAYDLLKETSADSYYYLKDSAGVIRTTEYATSTTATTSTAGDLINYPKSESIKQGDGGTAIKQSSAKYILHTESSVTVHRVAESTVYPGATTSGDGDAVTTKYTYTWFSGTNVVESITSWQPVSEGNNNPATDPGLESVEYYDAYSNLIWTKDENGLLTHHEYDNHDRLVKTINDVDDSEVTDEPTGWTTPTGGGLHLVSDYTYDSRDRLTETLGPEYKAEIDDVLTTVRSANWTLYNEQGALADDETYSASGYKNGSTYVMVGGIQVTKTDKAGRTTDSILVTQDVWTDTDTDDRLNAGDTVSLTDQTKWKNWAVSEYDENGLSNVRTYHDIPSSGSGSISTNYSRTFMFYDDLGRQYKTVNASNDTDEDNPTGITSWTFWSVDTDTYGGTYREVRQYPHVYSDSGYKLSGPISVTLTDADGNTVRTFTATATISGAAPTGTETLTELSRTSYTYDWRDRTLKTRSYFSLPAKNADGTEGTNYFESEVLAYDNVGRAVRSEIAAGVITASLYDATGRTVSSWRGTEATNATRTDPDGSGSPNDMEMVSKTYYDLDYDGTGTSVSYATRTFVVRPGIDQPTESQLDGEYTLGNVTHYTYVTNEPYSGTETVNSMTHRVSWTKPAVGPWTKGTSDGVATGYTSAYKNGQTTGANVLTKSEMIPGYDTISSVVYPITRSWNYEVLSGAATSNYLETVSWQDLAGRVCKSKDLNGSFTKMVFDDAGRVSETYYCSGEGADENPTVLTNDVIVTVSKTTYDVHGRVSKRQVGYDTSTFTTVQETRYGTGASGTGTETGRVTTVLSVKAIDTLAGTDADYAVTQYEYYLDNRKTTVILPAPESGGDKTLITTTVDPLGRTITQQTYRDDSPDVLLAQTANEYATGTYDGVQLTSTKTYVVTSGSAGNYLETTYDYDDFGRQCKVTQSSGAFSKTIYSLDGSVTASYLCTAEGGTTDVDNVTADTVVSETIPLYDQAGNVLSMRAYARNHDDTTTSGALSSGWSDLGDARIQITAQWYDDLMRVTHRVNYGTNDAALIDDADDDFDPETAGTQDYEDGAVEPNTSDKYIATKTTYDGYGRVDEVTDNKGVVTKTFYDSSSRTQYVVENYKSGATYWDTEPSDPKDRDSDTCRITKYDYNAFNQTTTITAIDPDADGATTDNQATRYVYGDELTAKGCPARRNTLLRAVIYPDSDDTVTSNALADGTDAAYDRVEMTYHADGNLATRKDPRETVRTLEYDIRARQTKDRVTAQGDSAVDLSVRAILTAYDDLGRVEKISSYSEADPTVGTDTPNTEVLREYDGLGRLSKEYQEHDGAKDGSTLYTEYTYDDTASSSKLTKGGRLKYVTYPNARKVHYVYNGHNGVDDVLSRVNKVCADNAGAAGTTIAEYKYLGDGTQISKDYATPEVKLNRYAAGTGGDTYAYLDRFGRVATHLWLDHSGASNVDVLKIDHGYDRASNRTYAERHVYKGESHVYGYDNLHRLTSFKAGLIKTDHSDLKAGTNAVTDNYLWFSRSQTWTLDALGNQTAVKDFKSDPWYGAEFNKANEYDDDDDDYRAKGNTGKHERQFDYFNSDTSSDYTCPGTNDVFTVDAGDSNELRFTTVSNDTIEDEARAFVVVGENVGPTQLLTYVKFPSGTTAGYAGMVFGYKDNDDYWMYVLDIAAQKRRLYHVQNGSKGTAVAEISSTINAGTSYSLYGHAGAGSLRKPLYAFTNGYPSGKVGLVTSEMTDGSQAGATFADIRVPDDAQACDLLGRWWNNTISSYVHSSKTDTLYANGSWNTSYNPKLLRKMRLDKFQATFAMTRYGTSDRYVYFAFNAEDQSNWNAVVIRHYDTPTAPSSYKVVDGGLLTSVGYTTRDATEGRVPTLTSSDTLWSKIECDGSTVKVWCAKDNTATSGDDVTWPAAADYAFASSSFTMDGGMIGFLSGAAYVDNLTIRRWDSGTSDWKTDPEVVEGFEIDETTGSAEDEHLEHDAAGNMTYDGEYKYVYDAWNRMVAVKRAYRESDGDLAVGSQIATITYDGLGRRIVKDIDHAGDWDNEYHYYYSGQQMIETRNGSSQTLTQHLWGPMYVDELLQIAINGDPGTDNDCLETGASDASYYALQDANYNVLAIVASDGDLAERYEYTPYGQRTIFKSPGSNDVMCHAAILESQRVTADSSEATYGICDIGHQGLMHDKEFGLIYNRARYLHSRHGRFMQQDPLGYADGMSLYEYVGSDPVGWVDPSGTRITVVQGSLKDGGEVTIRMHAYEKMRWAILSRKQNDQFRKDLRMIYDGVHRFAGNDIPNIRLEEKPFATLHPRETQHPTKRRTRDLLFSSHQMTVSQYEVDLRKDSTTAGLAMVKSVIDVIRAKRKEGRPECCNLVVYVGHNLRGWPELARLKRDLVRGKALTPHVAFIPITCMIESTHKSAYNLRLFRGISPEFLKKPRPYGFWRGARWQRLMTVFPHFMLRTKNQDRETTPEHQIQNMGHALFIIDTWAQRQLTPVFDKMKKKEMAACEHVYVHVIWGSDEMRLGPRIRGVRGTIGRGATARQTPSEKYLQAGTIEWPPK